MKDHPFTPLKRGVLLSQFTLAFTLCGVSVGFAIPALQDAPGEPSIAAPPPSVTQPTTPSSSPVKTSPRILSEAGTILLDRLSALKFDTLGHPAVRWDAIPPVSASRDQPHQLLVVLVGFKDLGFDRFKGKKNQDELLRAHYQRALFDPEYVRPNTLSHYYRTQSFGQYHLQGRVLPTIQLDHERAYYGRPKRPQGGSWRNDSRVEDLVEEVLSKVGQRHPELDWANFDRWDPTDADGDGIREEGDGYLDHLVMIYAGGGQSSCQSLYKLHNKLNPNVGPEVFSTLASEALECADRIWPHRFMVQRREGQGPQLSWGQNRLGGAPIRETLWAKDYNMQSEYTAAATFIHEFGHSIGLPDIYARQTSNSTGAWEVMSSTKSPSPQGLSAWSRMMLGWLTPQVVLPPERGGAHTVERPLMTLDTPPGLITSKSPTARSADPTPSRAILVALPPQQKSIVLTALKPELHGQKALYSGQGNELNRSVSLKLNLSTILPSQEVTLSFDGWWEIEAGWDFAYVEVRPNRADASWTRVVDSATMTAKHGHDGPKSLPGFSGRSGDLNGDGKNESNPSCDPKEEIKQGEERKGVSPCEVPTWSRAQLNLSPWAGQEVLVRLRYFTDMAAVERGILIDNIKVSLKGQPTPIFEETFEGPLSPSLSLDGFLLSAGAHHFETPHYYLIEHRDPYAGSADPKSPDFRYDSALGKGGIAFFHHPKTNEMMAMKTRARSGALIWYANGVYPWSENEPTQNGPGRGFLLAIDALPNEFRLPGWGDYLEGAQNNYDLHYNFKKKGKAPTSKETISDQTQALLRSSALKTMCFVRTPGYYPKDLPKTLFDACPGPQLAHLRDEGKTPRFVYEVINELLPGADRAPYRRAGELYDYKVKGERVTWSLRDRVLRGLHMIDAPFSPKTFEGGMQFYKTAKGGEIALHREVSFPPVDTFSDASPRRWRNPHLRFGGVEVPTYGVKISFSSPPPPSQSNPHKISLITKIQWD
jgi:immune inhibitor A